ncbi:MAG TPA: hypothetical protein VGS21_02955 [Acidimicrobiales bacterium]|nr:hypothetical protein [Acidimicrobiales bacterium]
MVTFLVEAYCSAATLAAGPSGIEDVATAARKLAADGNDVRLVNAILVPKDEACFYLFEAESVQALLAAAAQMGLGFERLSEAIPVWPAPLHPIPDPIKQLTPTSTGE